MTHLDPLPFEEWNEDLRSAVAVLFPRVQPQDSGNIVATLARHPALALGYLNFNSYLLYGTVLPERAREIAILRIAHRCDCPYLWSHHIPIGVRAGLTQENFGEITAGCARDVCDQQVLLAVDELEERVEIRPETWESLGESFDDRQRMDLVFTVGAYRMLAMAIKTFGIQPEDSEAPQK